MRKTYLIFASVFGLMGLILAFENIVIQSPGMIIFFDFVTGSMFWPLILIFSIGFASGFFFGLYLKTEKKKTMAEYSDNVDI